MVASIFHRVRPQPFFSELVPKFLQLSLIPLHLLAQLTHGRFDRIDPLLSMDVFRIAERPEMNEGKIASRSFSFCQKRFISSFKRAPPHEVCIRKLLK